MAMASWGLSDLRFLRPAAGPTEFYGRGLAAAIFEAASKRRKNVAARHDADDTVRLSAREDRQTADAVANHVIGCLADGAIFVDEFREMGQHRAKRLIVGGICIGGANLY